MANLLFRLEHLLSGVAHGVSYYLGWLKILADQVGDCAGRDAEFEISGALGAPNDQLQRFRHCSDGPISAPALAATEIAN
jgi:hypothetical protein